MEVSIWVVTQLPIAAFKESVRNELLQATFSASVSTATMH